MLLALSRKSIIRCVLGAVKFGKARMFRRIAFRKIDAQCCQCIRQLRPDFGLRHQHGDKFVEVAQRLCPHAPRRIVITPVKGKTHRIGPDQRQRPIILLSSVQYGKQARTIKPYTTRKSHSPLV
jgi:hypothetical protein